MAVRRRLHPHPPRTRFGFTSYGDILGDRPCRPSMLHETRMIENIAASHIFGVLLGKCM
jgi:hypothetical protein